MKHQISSTLAAGLLSTILGLCGGCLQSVGPVETVADSSGDQLDASAQSSDDSSEIAEIENPAREDVSYSAVTNVSNEIAIPVDLRPGPGTIEIIKLANSGAAQELLLSFVTNSTERFSLGPEEIIYLNDIGVPGRVITAMLQRDHILQAAASTEPEEEAMVEIQTPPWRFDDESPAVAEATEAPPQNSVPFAGDQQDLAALPPAPGEASAPNSEEPLPSTAAPEFYDALAPYGSWVDVDSYGRCWQPTVVMGNPDWQPYFDNGRWVYTDSGWYWNSDYSWGWAAFHYGRWFRHARLGWCWCPDNVWAPSWVCWRSTDDYCGWAPLPPGACFTTAGVTFRGMPFPANYHFGLGWDCFRFVATHDFCSDHVARHALPRNHIPRFFHHTVVSNPTLAANHRVINDGIGRERIVAAIRHQIPTVSLRQTGRAGGSPPRERFEANGRTLAIFRPHEAVAGGSAEASASAIPIDRIAQATTVHAVGKPARPEHMVAAAQVAPITAPHTTQRIPDPNGALILRGSRQNSATPLRASAGSSASSQIASARTVPRTAGNTTSFARTAPTPTPVPHSSFVVIGRRGGHDTPGDRHTIKVLASNGEGNRDIDRFGAGGLEQHQSRPVGVAYREIFPANDARSPVNFSANRHQHAAMSIARQQDQDANPVASQPSQVPWWITRPAQAPAQPAEPWHYRTERGQVHSDQGYSGHHGSHTAIMPEQREQHYAPPAHQEPVHSAPAPSHTESHSSAPAASSSSGHDHSASSSSGRGR